MRWSLVLLLLATTPVFAKELAPSKDIELAAKGRLKYLAYCAPARTLAATIEGGETAVYRLDLAKGSAHKLGVIADAYKLAFNADCSLLAIGVATPGATRKHDVHVYKLSAGAPVSLVSFGAFAYPVSALAFVDASLAVGLNKGPVELWAIDGGKARSLATRVIDGGVMSLAVGDGRIAIGTYEGGVYLSTIANGTLGPPVTLAGKAANTREKGSINTSTGEIVMPGGGRVFDVVFVDGGKRLLASQESGQIASWPLTNGVAGKATLVATKLDSPTELAVSTDEKLLATGDNTRVIVWHSTGDKRVIELGKLDRVGTYAGFSAVAFAGPREVLVGGFTTARVRLYRVP